MLNKEHLLSILKEMHELAKKTGNKVRIIGINKWAMGIISEGDIYEALGIECKIAADFTSKTLLIILYGINGFKGRLVSNNAEYEATHIYKAIDKPIVTRLRAYDE